MAGASRLSRRLGRKLNYRTDLQLEVMLSKAPAFVAKSRLSYR